MCSSFGNLTHANFRLDRITIIPSDEESLSLSDDSLSKTIGDIDLRFLFLDELLLPLLESTSEP